MAKSDGHLPSELKLVLDWTAGALVVELYCESCGLWAAYFTIETFHDTYDEGDFGPGKVDETTILAEHLACPRHGMAP